MKSLDPVQELLHSFRVTPISGGLSETDNSWRDDNFCPEYARFKYVLSGKCLIGCNGGSHTVTPKNLFLIPEGDDQWYAPHPEASVCRQYFIHFNAYAGTGESIFNLLDAPLSVPVKKNDRAELIALFDKYAETLKKYSSAGPLRAKAAVTDLLAFFFERSGLKVKPAVTDLLPVVTYVKQHLDKKIKVNQLAKIACLQPEYFSRKFRSVFGCPPSEFVLRKRIEKACVLLTSGDKTIDEIAVATGFCDAYQFSRMFKKKIGLPPSEYRKVSRTH